MQLLADHREDSPYRATLVRELVAYNDRNAPAENWRHIGFFAVSDAGELLGGIQGNFEWDWLHLTHLWVKEAGRGLGRQLVENAEAFAKENGKRGIFLDTFDFQAKPFYEKLGFVIVGKIENAAGLSARYFMLKLIS